MGLRVQFNNRERTFLRHRRQTHEFLLCLQLTPEVTEADDDASTPPCQEWHTRIFDGQTRTITAPNGRTGNPHWSTRVQHLGDRAERLGRVRRCEPARQEVVECHPVAGGFRPPKEAFCLGIQRHDQAGTVHHTYAKRHGLEQGPGIVLDRGPVCRHVWDMGRSVGLHQAPLPS